MVYVVAYTLIKTDVSRVVTLDTANSLSAIDLIYCTKMAQPGVKDNTRYVSEKWYTAFIVWYSKENLKFVKQQYLLHMSPQYANFGPLAAEIGPLWGTPANFN